MRCPAPAPFPISAPVMRRSGTTSAERRPRPVRATAPSSCASSARTARIRSTSSSPRPRPASAEARGAPARSRASSPPRRKKRPKSSSKVARSPAFFTSVAASAARRSAPESRPSASVAFTASTTSATETRTWFLRRSPANSLILSSIGSGEELGDGPLGGVELLARADVDEADDALAIDDHERRDRRHLVARRRRAVGVAGDRVAEVLLVRVLGDDLPLLGRDANDAEALLSPLLLPGGEARHGGVARAAPRGPELDEDDVAAEVAEARRVRPLGLGEGEGRGRLPEQMVAEELHLVGSVLERERDGHRLVAADQRQRDLLADALLLDPLDELGRLRDGVAVDGADLVAVLQPGAGGGGVLDDLLHPDALRPGLDADADPRPGGLLRTDGQGEEEREDRDEASKHGSEDSFRTPHRQTLQEVG